MDDRRRRRLRGALVLVGLALLLGNALAARHAWLFVTFDEDAAPAARTPTPGELGRLARLRVLALGVTSPRPRDAVDPTRAGLPFETLALAAADGVRLAAWHLPCAGARATVVVVPGYAASKGALLPRAVAWHALGVEVVLLDPRGVGGSEGRRTTLGIDEALDVAAAVAWARGHARGRPVLADGVSMGGAAAVRAVARHGAVVDGLVLESVFDRLSTTVARRFEAMGLPGRPGAALLLLWGSVLLRRDAWDDAPLLDAPAVRCPSLVLGGADDPWVRPGDTRALASALAGPVDLVVVDGVGHAQVLGGAPARWQAAAQALLARVGSP